MTIYRLTIRPLTSFRTPLQSDTIFGHLMWALRYLEGEDALLAFLDRYRTGEPPLLVSAGFPGDTLPVPVLPSTDENEEDEGDSGLADQTVKAMLRKALEDDRYLPLPQWHELAPALSAERLDDLREEARSQLRRLRVTATRQAITRTAVDRMTGSAREGRLFVSEETFYVPQRTFDIWHKVLVKDDDMVKRLNQWWDWVRRNGFGRGKSSGHGAFRIVGDGLTEAGGDLSQVEEPNGFVSLSAWIPRQSDPTDVTYHTRVKRGKLGEAMAIPSPWKKPLLMLEPGAVARLGGGESVREWYGRLVEDVHWTYDEIVQYGYAFPMPVRIEGGNR
jgi:CRISPR-associated protein Csm4